MAKTIQQKIVFKNTTTGVLYNFYMNAKLHSQLTGGETKISEKEGARFSAYDGYCGGKNLQLIRNRLIVQSWRSADWSDDDVDSTFILLFEQMGNDSIITIVHANVPDKHFAGVKAGWDDYYWKPRKKYFAEKTKK